MLPRLQAEEALSAATVAALGAGRLKPYEAARVTAQLERKAAGHRRAPRADARVLAMMGIKVVRHA